LSYTNQGWEVTENCDGAVRYCATANGKPCFLSAWLPALAALRGADVRQGDRHGAILSPRCGGGNKNGGRPAEPRENPLPDGGGKE